MLWPLFSTPFFSVLNIRRGHQFFGRLSRFLLEGDIQFSEKNRFTKTYHGPAIKTLDLFILIKLYKCPGVLQFPPFSSRKKNKTSTAIVRRKFIFASLQIRTNVAEDPYPSTMWFTIRGAGAYGQICR